MNQSVHDLAEHLLRSGYDDLPDRDRRLLVRLAERSVTTRNVNDDYDKSLSFGQKVADRVASFGGSWTFILSFIGFLVAWIVFNVAMSLNGRALDPYPFIFLNLILSMIAALQAPIIMMSQNRQSIKDRLDAAHDYEVNLRAELEISELHRKLEQVEERLHQAIAGQQAR
jgi:uncharacterized membrane protein